MSAVIVRPRVQCRTATLPKPRESMPLGTRAEGLPLTFPALPNSPKPRFLLTGAGRPSSQRFARSGDARLCSVVPCHTSRTSVPDN